MCVYTTNTIRLICHKPIGETIQIIVVDGDSQGLLKPPCWEVNWVNIGVKRLNCLICGYHLPIIIMPWSNPDALGKKICSVYLFSINPVTSMTVQFGNGSQRWYPLACMPKLTRTVYAGRWLAIQVQHFWYWCRTIRHRVPVNWLSETGYHSIDLLSKTSRRRKCMFHTGIRLNLNLTLKTMPMTTSICCLDTQCSCHVV